MFSGSLGYFLYLSSYGKFEAEVTEGDIFFAVVSVSHVEMPSKFTPLSADVGRLLDEFDDVLIDELPPSRPMSNIQHQIHLFPDVAIPNRLH